MTYDDHPHQVRVEPRARRLLGTVRGGYLSYEREPDGGADSLASLATVPFSLPSSPMVMSFRACDL